MSKSVTVNTPKELGEALVDKADEIRIEGELAKRVQRIRATNRFKWVAVYGCLAGAVVAVASGIGIPAATVLAGVALVILGYHATFVAISIGVAGKGAEVLKVLRNDYREVERGEAHLVLKRR